MTLSLRQPTRNVVYSAYHAVRTWNRLNDTEDIMADKTYQNPISKYIHEFMYWRRLVDNKGPLKNSHYEGYFTAMFDVDKDFYSNKRVMDLGCGPCGSLEWADNARQRVGLDPLAEAYAFLHDTPHAMEYTPDFAESISFEENHFDVLVSINSLDHVDDGDKVISEIKRVVKPGGHIFIAAEVSKDKKPCEPSPITWDLAERFSDVCEIIDELHLTYDGSLAAAIRKGESYNHDSPQTPSGALRLRLLMK